MPARTIIKTMIPLRKPVVATGLLGMLAGGVMVPIMFDMLAGVK